VAKGFDAAAATHYQDSVGVIAAWAADEDMLGHGLGGEHVPAGRRERAI